MMALVKLNLNYYYEMTCSKIIKVYLWIRTERKNPGLSRESSTKARKREKRKSYQE